MINSELVFDFESIVPHFPQGYPDMYDAIVDKTRSAITNVTRFGSWQTLRTRNSSEQERELLSYSTNEERRLNAAEYEARAVQNVPEGPTAISRTVMVVGKTLEPASLTSRSCRVPYAHNTSANVSGRRVGHAVVSMSQLALRLPRGTKRGDLVDVTAMTIAEQLGHMSGLVSDSAARQTAGRHCANLCIMRTSNDPIATLRLRDALRGRIAFCDECAHDYQPVRHR